VREVLDRLPFERALQLSIAALVLVTVLSQGALLSWIGPARKLRWAALFILAALAVGYALRRRDRWVGFVHPAAAALALLALASVLWSSFPRLAFERAAAFTVLLTACGALAAGAAGRSQALRLHLHGVVLGAAAVGYGGLLVLAFRHDRAVEPATSVLPARYQGLGGGPNTAMMVLAVAVPLTAYAVLEARRSIGRAVAGATLLVLVGSIVASGSRGALVAGFGGLFAFGVLAPLSVRRRALTGAAVLVLLAIAALVTRIPKPNPSAPPLPSAAQPAPATHPHSRPISPVPPPRLEDDVGHPPYGIGETTKMPRTLFGSSGRAQAWSGAIQLGAERPLVGFGFGTEDHVFVDRYSDFNSNVPENSYIGLFLQLGLVGLVAFVAFYVWLLVRGVAASTRMQPADRRVVAACAGGVVAGLVLAGFQSYLYAVGNNATAAVWICAFLLAAATGPTWNLRRALPPILIAAVACLLLVPIGRAERAHRAHLQVDGMQRVAREVGALDGPALDSYRYLSLHFECLLYRRGRDPFALELCIDGGGRVVETIDRRTAPKPRIHSLRDDPTRSTLHVDRSEVTRLLHELDLSLPKETG